MKFAKIVFRVAAIWGVLIITPLYLMFDLIGRQDPPPITHPAFFYGFVGLALAWQIAFFFIAIDPVRYRPLMIPSMFEKLAMRQLWSFWSCKPGPAARTCSSPERTCCSACRS
jgi:hypothetical protein